MQLGVIRLFPAKSHSTQENNWDCLNEQTFIPPEIQKLSNIRLQLASSVYNICFQFFNDVHSSNQEQPKIFNWIEAQNARWIMF